MKHRLIFTVFASMALLLPLGLVAANGAAPEGIAENPPESVDRVVEIGPAATPLRTITVTGTGELVPVEVPTGPEMTDYVTFAKTEGISVEELLASLQGRDEFGEAIATLEKHHADTYAGSWWKGAEGQGPTITLTEAPNADVMKLMAALPVDTVIRYGAPLSETDQELLHSAALMAISAAYDNEIGATSGVNPYTMSVEVEYRSLDGTMLPPLNADEIADSIRTAVDADQLDAPIRFIHTPGLGGFELEA